MKTVYTKGFNDADYKTHIYERIDGKSNRVSVCPYYKTWSGMLQRCYSNVLHLNRPTYKDCSVIDEWLTFSNFKKWMELQEWQGMHLDKDLLVEGNRVYSPDRCIFIHRKVNNFITDNASRRNGRLAGASWNKVSKRYYAQCGNMFTGKNESLGMFDSELEAHLAWKKKKHELACQLADSDFVNNEGVSNALRIRYLELDIKTRVSA